MENHKNDECWVPWCKRAPAVVGTQFTKPLCRDHILSESKAIASDEDHDESAVSKATEVGPRVNVYCQNEEDI